MESTIRHGVDSSLVGASLRDIDDPNVALITFVSELEQTVRLVAKAHGLNPSTPLRHLITELSTLGMIRKEVEKGLTTLVRLRNHAAHGAPVSPQILDVIRDDGIHLLEEFESLAQPSSRGPTDADPGKEALSPEEESEIEEHLRGLGFVE